MSCRTTSGGRAASACATLLVPGCSSRIPAVLHRLKASADLEFANSPNPSTQDVIDALEQMALRARHETDVSESRRNRVLAKIESAIDSYRGGAEPLPDFATLQAWKELPSALITEDMRAAPVTDTATFDLPPEFEPGVDQVRPYHLAFPNLNPQIVGATDSLFSARPSRLSFEEAEAECNSWLARASSIYGVPRPSLSWDPSVVMFGGGVYTYDSRNITMSKVSLTTLMHEFRHHLQRHGAPMIDPDLEEDARAWSLSLYYSVRPNLLKKMVQQGRIFHIEATDFETT